LRVHLCILLLFAWACAAFAAPANDNRANALPITSEFGSYTNQSNVGSTSEPNPWPTSPYSCPGYTTNGHDVWFKWQHAWIISAGQAYGNRSMAYDLWLDHCTNDLVIRIYFTTNSYYYDTDVSKDRFTQSQVGLNPFLSFCFDPSTPPNPGVSWQWWTSNMWVWVQVDSAQSGTNAHMGTFDLHWRRSDVPNIGSLTNFSAFATPRDRRPLLVGGLSISDVSTQWAGFYQMGETQRPGLYRAQYAGGWYKIADATPDWPPGPTIVDANFEVLYNDGVPPHDGLTNWLAWQPGCAVPALFTKPDGTYTDETDPLWTSVYQRFAMKTFWHAGGQIGLQFRDFYGFNTNGTGGWVGPCTLPAYAAQQFWTPDFQYLDNTWLDPPLSVVLWRLVPKLNFQFVNGWFLGSHSSTPNCYFIIKNNTCLDLTGVRLYKKVGGVPAQVSTNNIGAYANVTPALNVSLSPMPLIQTIYFELVNEPDVPAFPVVIDFTPRLEIWQSSYYGVVSDGGVQKWSCQVRFKNNGLGPWLNQPSGALVAGQREGSSVTYQDGQALFPFIFNDAWLNFYVRPPANASAATFTFQVTDSGWTSPTLTATISGAPLGYGVPAGDSLSSGSSSSSGSQSSSTN
jgi:hypothetical protein